MGRRRDRKTELLIPFSMPNRDLRLLGVVLCGGRSKRMGRDKAELKTCSGSTFLNLTFQRLNTVCETVCLSESRDRGHNIQQIADPPVSHGPISGIDASLCYAKLHGYDACVFNPVDTPRLTVDAMNTLIDVFCSNPLQIVCAVNDESDSNGPTSPLEPLIAIYPISVSDTIHDAINRSHYSLQKVLATLPVARVTLPANVCRNVNTPSDFNQLSDDK